MRYANAAIAPSSGGVGMFLVHDHTHTHTHLRTRIPPTVHLTTTTFAYSSHFVQFDTKYLQQ